MKVISLNIIYLLFFLILYSSCNKNNSVGCQAKYSADIQPLIKAKCAINACHTSGSSLPDLMMYDVVKSYADNGRIRTNVFDLKIMPPASSDQLTDQEKETLKCWLDNGAPQN